MKKVFYLIIVLFSISTYPVFAQTNPITVQTDDNNYDEGDTIVISGQVKTIVTGTPVVLQIFFEGNLIDIAQLTVAQDASYTNTVIAEGPLWNKEGDYLIRASYGEGNIAETEFSFLPKTSIPETKNIFEVDAESHGTFDVEYTIKGGIIDDMLVDAENFALVVQIEAVDEGSITLSLPREFIDAEKQDGKDELFIVLIDDIEASYKETNSNSKSRTITVDFEEGDSEIQIIGTYAIPEFGTIAIMMLLVAITSVILVTKNRLQIKI